MSFERAEVNPAIDDVKGTAVEAKLRFDELGVENSFDRSALPNRLIVDLSYDFSKQTYGDCPKKPERFKQI